MTSRAAALALAAAAVALAPAAPALGAVGSTVLVSGPNVKDETGFTAETTAPAISGDGRFVAFAGTSGETGSGVFLSEIGGGTTSIDVPNGTTEQGLGFDAGGVSVSGDGRMVAFASEDPAISDEDRDFTTTPAGYTYPVRDIFVYDRLTGAITLASRLTGRGGAAANENSSLSSISADGRYVAFDTEATNFIHGVYGGVYVRDLRRATTTLAARANGPHGSPLDRSFNPSISAHGRWVAFVTLVHNRHGHTLEIAVRDVKTNRTVLASRASGRGGALAASDCHDPAISADGRFVAFSSKAANLGSLDEPGVEDIFVRDLKTNRTLLASRAQGRHGAGGSGDSAHPSISADGRYVAFDSYSSNLGPADNGTVPDVFVRDMRSGRVFLASRASGSGIASNAPSADPSLSADGRYVAFDSRASNLSPGDTLHAGSVFRYQVLP